MSTSDDSFCGIYCSACSVRRFGETGRADGFVSCLGDVPSDEIACSGCRSASVYAGCRVCTLRDCATAKGLSRCVDCAEYPCPPYVMWQKAATLLPHVREARASLEAIRRDGPDAWRVAQRARWSCPSCGSPLSWYARECVACGHAAGSQTYRISGLRRLVCRLVLPWTYRKPPAHPAAVLYSMSAVRCARSSTG
jgi:hypothetical protein